MAKYVLLRWNDGYQEVGALDGKSEGILRYYVIERIEKSGRLAIASVDDYPGLKVIGRKPEQIESISFIDGGEGKVFSLELKERKAEGDKVEHHYELKETDANVVVELIRNTQQIVSRLGIDAVAPPGEGLEAIRKALKLGCLEEQAEVLDFVKMLVRKCVLQESV